jgi:hypothetical protein
MLLLLDDDEGAPHVEIMDVAGTRTVSFEVAGERGMSELRKDATAFEDAMDSTNGMKFFSLLRDPRALPGSWKQVKIPISATLAIAKDEVLHSSRNV